MEIGEMIAAAKAAKHTDDDCPFCKMEEKINAKNFLKADYDEDTKAADNGTYNHSGILAKNLSGFEKYAKPHGGSNEVCAAELDVEKPVEKGEKAPYETMDFARAAARTWHKKIFEAGQIPVLYGAHHLISGNDGLKKSDLYKKGILGSVRLIRQP
ncbi:MAG: hypothetical protein COB33_010630 [Thiotrichaceae bacterium]|nr:hypothetical protein [Thiotrichaceae bacterium]